MLRRRLVVRVAAVLLAVPALAGCTSSGSSGPGGQPDVSSPQDAAQALGEALSTGDFSGVGFLDNDPTTATKQYAPPVAGLGKITPDVSLGEVTTPTGTPATATATYDWTWPI